MITRQLKRLYFLFFLLGIPFFIFPQASKLDSLLKLLKSDKQDTVQVSHLNNISMLYRMVSEFDSSLKYADIALKLSTSLSYKKGLGDALNNKGGAYNGKGENRHALDAYLRSLDIRKQVGDKKGIAIANNNVGNVYRALGDFPEALKSYLISYNIKEELGDTKGLAGTCNNIAIVFQMQGKMKESLEQFLKALNFYLQTGNKVEIAGIYNNIALIYFHLKQFENSLESFKNALKYYEVNGNKKGQADCLSNLGNLYDDMKMPDKAIDCYMRAMNMRAEMGDKSGLAASYINIGDFYFERKKMKEAKSYFAKALELSKSEDDIESLRNVYVAMAFCDSASGDFKSAFYNFRVHARYNDMIYNEENAKKNAKMSAEFESHIKDNEIKLLNKDKEKQAFLNEAERKKKNIIIWSVIAGLLLVIVFSAVVFQRWKESQKQKRIIETQKQVVLEKQREIIDSIKYAKRIQESLLASERYIERTLARLRSKS